MTDNLKMTDNPIMGPVVRPGMNLQLFNEEGEAAPVRESLQSFFEREIGGAAETDPPADPPADPYNVPSEEPGAEPPVEPVEEPGIPQYEIPEKFAGKTPEEVAKAYVELETLLGKHGVEKQQMQQQLRQMQQYVQYMAHQQRQQTRQTQPQLTPEEVQTKNEEWLNWFYKDPISALETVVQQRVSQVVQPLQQQVKYREHVEHYQQQVQQARGKWADFDQLMPVMREIIREQGAHLSNSPRAVETIYHIAKGRTAQEMQPQNPQQLVKDPKMREMFLNDESIKNEILKKYAQSVKEKQPPVTIGSQPGEIPAAPPEEIKSTKDAKKASISFFERWRGAK